MSLPRNHTHQDRLRDDFERTHTHLLPLGDYTTFGAPVPGRPQITFIVIWAFFTQDMTSLALLLQSHVGVGILQSSLLQGFLLHLMLSVIHVQIRLPSRSSSSKRRLQRSCSLQSLFKERYQEPFVPGALFSDNRRLRSRESPSPKQVGVAFKPLRMISPPRTLPGTLLDKWESLQGVPPLHSEWFRFKGVPFSKWMGFSPRGFPPSLQRMGFASRGSPSPSEWIHLKGFPLSSANGFASWGSPSPKRMGFASWGSPLSRGSPSPSE